MGLRSNFGQARRAPFASPHLASSPRHLFDSSLSSQFAAAGKFMRPPYDYAFRRSLETVVARLATRHPSHVRRVLTAHSHRAETDRKGTRCLDLGCEYRTMARRTIWSRNPRAYALASTRIFQHSGVATFVLRGIVLWLHSGRRLIGLGFTRPGVANASSLQSGSGDRIVYSSPSERIPRTSRAAQYAPGA